MGKNIKICTKLYIAFIGILLAVVFFCTLQTLRTAAVSERYEAVIEKYDTTDGEKADQYIEEAHDYRMQSEILSICFTVILSIIVIVLALLVVRSIRVPLRELVSVVRRLSTGDINVTIEKKNNDEIGEVVDAIIALLEKNKRAANIAREVSDGNLSMIVTPESDVDALGKAFKHLVDENNITLTNIRETANQVNSGSQQVATASQSLAQGSTQQASAIEQVTASINDITERTKVNASDATEANSLVQKTKENAAAGNQQMSQMVDAMKEINESSENISKIIKTIDDIAFQTNILALNAAVEAARAGEHGKGFAVVAEEVRSLAEKSAQAASETEDMIEDSILKVRNGSNLATQTAAMLGEIVAAVENTVVLIEEIANASNDQATALTQIEEAVNQLSKVVQTNSATSQECAAASEELSNQARNLEGLVDKYKLRNISGRELYTSQNPSAANSIGLQKDAFTVNEVPMHSAVDMQAGKGFEGNIFSGMTGQIPDASDFSDLTNEQENEQIISLEDNSYSKY